MNFNRYIDSSDACQMLQRSENPNPNLAASNFTESCARTSVRLGNRGPGLYEYILIKYKINMHI